MSACCPADMEPARECAGGQGVIKTYNGTSLFVAGPATSKAGVLSFPDVLGPDSGRIKKDAEALGKLGYVVVVVDLVDSDWVDINDMSGIGEWVSKYNFDAVSGKVRTAIEYLQKEAGVEAISSYGYCWGGWVGASQSATADPVLKGHVSFHPSWKIEELLKGEGAVEKLTEKITVPQLLLSAGNDPDYVREGGSVQKILKAKGGVVGELSEVVDFPDMIHGWVNRGDLEDETVKENVKKAWHKAIKFTQTVNPL